MANAALDANLLVSECAAQEGASDADIEKIGMERPTTKVGKCFHACFSEKMGLVSTRSSFFHTIMTLSVTS